MDTIYGGFCEQVARDPEALAVIDEYGQLTYEQLAAMAESIANEIPANASFVGVIMEHSAEMLAAILGALKQGAAYIPAEPDFPKERIAFMLNEAKAQVVITQERFTGVVKDHDRIFVEPGASRSKYANASLSDLDLSTKAKPEDLAYVLYTSGTTGTPKGVCVDNHNVRSYIRAFHNEFENGPSDRMLQHSVCSFDIFVEEVFSTLLTGGTLVIAPDRVKRDVEKLVKFIEDNEVTIVDGFPYLMGDINSAEMRPTTVRLYVSGGDVLHERQVNKLVNEAMVYDTYGPSETTCCVSYFRCDGAKPSEDGTYPIGHPITGTRIEVVDEALAPLPPGEAGELLITGPGVSHGYLGEHPEQENFLINEDGEKQYRSGDVGYVREDGNVIFLHRKDDQVMIGGKRVEAKEVENVLLQDASIHQAVVVPGCDEEGSSYLMAYITPTSEDLSLSALRKRLSRYLTPFMIPEFFIKMDSIPLNTNGKPDVEKLPVVLKAGA